MSQQQRDDMNGAFVTIEAACVSLASGVSVYTTTQPQVVEAVAGEHGPGSHQVQAVINATSIDDFYGVIERRLRELGFGAILRRGQATASSAWVDEWTARVNNSVPL